MDERFRHLLERFPNQTGIIRDLAETHARFKDLISDHYEVCEEISRVPLADHEANFRKREDLRHRKVNLEEELLLLMQDQQRT